MNIVLTGFMGTGKTAVGKRLAEEIGMQYIDTDEMIEKDVGMNIPDIFKRRGEKYFREVETQALKCVAMLDNFVIATGGGVVLKEENMEELEKNGIIICLTASANTILQRTGKDTNRPLLKGENPADKINQLLKEREPFYKRCHKMIDTSGKDIKEIIEEIVPFFKEVSSSKIKK